MECIKIKLGDDMSHLETSFEKTIDEMFHAMRPIFRLSEKAWKPSMDIVEAQDEIIVLAELAGVEKEHLEVEINSKAVRIFGKRMESTGNIDGRYRLAEIQYGSFERILFLPAPIDPEVVSATFNNGFLQIRLARLPLDKTYKISIS